MSAETFQKTGPTDPPPSPDCGHTDSCVEVELDPRIDLAGIPNNHMTCLVILAIIDSRQTNQNEVKPLPLLCSSQHGRGPV